MAPKEYDLSLSLPIFAFVFANSAVLVSALLVLALEFFHPALRSPDARFTFRAQALMLQQWLSLISIALAFVALYQYLPNTDWWLWACLSLLLITLLPSFWLRKVDLMQAIRGVNWRGAQKRSQQLQLVLLVQSVLSLFLLMLGVNFEATHS